jgi:L-cystine transport system substrate-binding protein
MVVNPGVAEAQEVHKIYVGTQSDFPPFFFLDENHNLTGFDIELLRKIDERIPDLELDFLVTAWDGVLLGLESNKSQLVAVSLSWTEERAQKYYLSSPYYIAQEYIAVKQGRTDIQSLEDLKGKSLAVVVGTGVASGLEKWNEANGNEIKLVYIKPSTNMGDPLLEVETGRVDAWVEDIVNIRRVLKEKNLKIEVVGKPVLEFPIVFAFRKDTEGAILKAKVDQAIAELKADGTIKALAREWIGTDEGVPN